MSAWSLALARVIHVVGIVLWIGGVAFVTTILIPALRRLPSGEERLRLFEALEGRFSVQARDSMPGVVIWTRPFGGSIS